MAIVDGIVGGLVAGLVVNVMTKLGTRAVREFGSAWGVKKEVEDLRDTLATILDYLADAEQKQLTDNKVGIWLTRIKDAVYDADDIIDEFLTEAERRRLAKQDKIFRTSKSHSGFCFKTARRIKKVRETLGRIKDDQLSGLIHHSSVYEGEVVFGRDEERDEIVKLLLDSSGGDTTVSVIPIIGMGGIGKTTFAKCLNIQSIENPSRLEPTVQNLLGELDALKRIRDEMVKRGDQQINTWLENVRDSEVQIDVIKKDLDERNRDLHLNDLSRRVKLKAELIESVKVVKVLKERAVEKFLHGITGDQLKRFSYDDLISFTSKFSEEIGSGAFGIVYRGRFPNDVQVAVKVLVQNILIDEIFMIEVGTMLKASHPNLIKLYGFCFDGNMKALVYEFMEKGSLNVVLLQNPCPVEWQALYGIALEIAMVLAYLHHDCDDRIIHHDVKPSNILLDSKLSPKVTDFGTARIMNSDVSHFTMTSVRGTCGYTAPEMIIHSSRVTYKCDVYSYGKLLFDILGIKSNTHEQVWGKFVKGELDETIKECGIMEKDIKRARILCLVAFWCIQFSEEIRPSMKEVVNALEMKMQVAKPPNPFLSWTGNFFMQQSDDSPSADERSFNGFYSGRTLSLQVQETLL